MANRIRLKRKMKLFERSVTWLVLSAILFCILSVGTYFLFRSIRESIGETRLSMFNLIAGLGILAAVLILVVVFYSVRKRRIQEAMPGTMMAWLKSHVYLAFIALGLVLIHGFLAIFKSEMSSGKIALGLFGVLVLSGVIWRLMYSAVPPVVSKSVGNLAVQDTRTKSNIVQIEIDKLLAGKSEQFRRAADGIKSGASQSRGSARQVPVGEEADWSRYKKLVERNQRYRRREKLQSLYSFIMQVWKWLHIPLAVGFLVFVGYHLSEVFQPVKDVETFETAGLPAAQECARCHQEIVDEWELAMHAEAQTGAVVVAQTRLALERSPEFGRACNNCHAPVGTSLTGFESLPLDEDDQFRSQPNGAIIDDGVTCIVCHTISEAPTERRGMFDDFPFVAGGATFFADMFGPPLIDPPATPNTWHNSKAGFMVSPVASSQLCGSCHNVKVDINGDGEVGIFPGSDKNLQDSDNDKQLDENELDIDENGRLNDLVLQTTFDEWEDYVADNQSKGEPALGCVDCHMPQVDDSPIVTPQSGFSYAPAPNRQRHSHAFVGIDYDLTPGRYTAEELETILKHREELLRSAANLSISINKDEADELKVTITVNNNLEGHNLPTGFAFARQMWLEVSAETIDGDPVCLADADVNGTIISAKCASGVIETPQSNLLTCDPQEVESLGINPSKNGESLLLNSDSIEPLEDCDPWLANFQKVLTRELAGTFIEVPYQSVEADIVKTRVRVSDGQPMDAFNSTRLVNGEPHNSASFDYIFNTSGLNNEEVIIKAVLHFRHLPPYFLKALDGNYPDGITSADLLSNLTVVDMDEVEFKVRVP